MTTTTTTTTFTPSFEHFEWQEEVEQAELEQAIAMSLALEAKRIEYATLPDGGEGGGGRRAGAVAESSAVSQKLQRDLSHGGNIRRDHRT